MRTECCTQGVVYGSHSPDDPMPILLSANRNPYRAFPFKNPGGGLHTHSRTRYNCHFVNTTMKPPSTQKYFWEQILEIANMFSQTKVETPSEILRQASLKLINAPTHWRYLPPRASLFDPLHQHRLILIFLCIYTCIYIHIHTHTHTHAHILIFWHSISNSSWPITATHYTTLHHTAPRCTTLHHTASHCTTLHHNDHTAPHCIAYYL